jgi:ribosome maturation factor RimP
MISKKLVMKLIDERIAELANGLFVVDLSISNTNVIHVEIDKHVGGVAITDCMSVSRNVEHNLDREEEDFEIHVSSAGLDKSFRVMAQYDKNIGKEVKVLLNDKTKLEGILKAASEQEIIIETSRMERPEGDALSLSKRKKKKELIVEQHVFPMDQVKETKIVISFK